MGQRIAVIGTGISGLGAAWALHKDNDVVVYEADDRIGGHSNTVDVNAGSTGIPVDTGFIVYNEVTYPNLTRLFEALEVPTERSDMSFSFSLDRDLEYAASLRGVLSRPSNLAKRRFRRMLFDINRFRKEGTDLHPRADEPVGELLLRHGYSEGFMDDYLFPMTGAIWSTSQDDIRNYPAASILRFLSNHGLIEIVGRPGWRTVSGGSRSYVDRLVRPFADRIRLSSPVTRVWRDAAGVTVDSRYGLEMFDQVILATHTDQSLRLLGDDATFAESRHLAAIRYEPNVAILHGDPSLMPRSRSVWSSWNAIATSADRRHRKASITYWMNRLQNIDDSWPLFVSINPNTEPDPDLTYARFEYSHPQFTGASVAAQAGIASLQGENRTWFAGAYMGYGFHEDGLQAGLNVAAALGSPAPWHGAFEPVSSAPPAHRPAVLV